MNLLIARQNGWRKWLDSATKRNNPMETKALKLAREDIHFLQVAMETLDRQERL